MTENFILYVKGLWSENIRNISVKIGASLHLVQNFFLLSNMKKQKGTSGHQERNTDSCQSERYFDRENSKYTFSSSKKTFS